MVREGVDFIVYDAKTNEDITRQVLTQIIFEAENSEQNLLPIRFLRQLIQLYGGNMQAMAPSYLEMSLDAFVRQSEQLREKWAAAFGKPEGFGMFEDQVRQNMVLFDRAMKMFNPFTGYGPAAASAAAPPRPKPQPTPEATPGPGPAEEGGDVADLRRRLDEMQRQIERLATGKG
jgi:polyhydroxyalkanoate synthesis repressor PhaR